MATPALLSDSSAIAVVLSLRDEAENISILRLANRPGIKQSGVAPVASPGLAPQFDGADDALFDDRLTSSIQLISRISFEQVGSEIRGIETSGGNIDFAIGMGNVSTDRNIDPELYSWLRLLWKGRTVTVYQGPSASKNFAVFTAIYQGIVDNLTHDLNTASVKLAGNSRLADRVVVEELYTAGAPDHLIGLPKPRIKGYVQFFAPILYDEATQLYHVSTVSGTPPLLDSITNVTVGGIPWEEVVTIDPEIPGQYVVDLNNGTLQLSGSPLNFEVRCDVKSADWADITTGEFVRLLLAEKNITYDTGTFTQLDTDVPYLIGYATSTEPENLLNVIDKVLLGAGAFRTESDLGEIRVYAIDAPSVSSDDSTYDLASINSDGIISFSLSSISARIYRFVMEYNLVWNPMQNFAENVSDENQKRWSGTGDKSTAVLDTDLRDFDPSSVASPTIRTYFSNPVHADNVGQRLGDAFTPERRIYDVVLTTETNDLYKTILVDYKMISNKTFRIISIQKNLGNHTQTIQIWG